MSRGWLCSCLNPEGTLNGEEYLGTHRNGAAGGTAGAVDAGMFGAGYQLVRTSESWQRTAVSLLRRGARGDPADGLLRAWIMSLASARTKSMEDTSSIVTSCCGNHSSVSQMCSRRVSQTQFSNTGTNLGLGPCTMCRRRGVIRVRGCRVSRAQGLRCPVERQGYN
jgi:hypothetical protein